MCYKHKSDQNNSGNPGTTENILAHIVIKITTRGYQGLCLQVMPKGEGDNNLVVALTTIWADPVKKDLSKVAGVSLG